MRGKYKDGVDGVRISAWTASTHSTQDAANPTAQMDAQADTQAGTEFVVSSGGSDDGSGVKDYTVQVQVDDGAWQT